MADSSATARPECRRHEELDPLLAQQLGVAQQGDHFVAEELLGSRRAHERHRDEAPLVVPSASRREGVHVRVPGDHIGPLSGPEEVPLVLSASAEKGLRVHFHTERTAPRYGELFWKHLAGFAESLQATIRDSGLPKDESSEESPLAWWRTMEAACRRMAERGEPVELVGVVPWEGDNPWKKS